MVRIPRCDQRAYIACPGLNEFVQAFRSAAGEPEGGEELYDHRKAPYEWSNLARNPESRKTMDRLAKLLPKENAPKKKGAQGGKKKGKR